MPGKPPRKENEAHLVQRDGALALTFVNTGSRRSPRLRSYAELLAWSQLHGGLAAADAQRLAARAAESPDDAAAVFAAAEELHSLLSTVMTARADRRAPTFEALADLNALRRRVVPHRDLVPGPASLQWDWPADSGDDLLRPLWTVVRSATDLLTSANYGKVRRCGNKDCDVLFLAKGPGSPRKWCNNRICGAPKRARSYYLRVRKPLKKATREYFRSGRKTPWGDP